MVYEVYLLLFMNIKISVCIGNSFAFVISSFVSLLRKMVCTQRFDSDTLIFSFNFLSFFLFTFLLY